MSSYRGVLSLSAEGGVKFLLGGDEGFVGFVVEGDVSEDGADDKRSDGFDGGIDGDGVLGFGEFEFGSGDLLKVDFEGSNKSSFGKEVWSVVHAIELVVEFFLGLCILFDGLLDFDTELESQFIQLMEGVLMAHELVKAVLFYFKVWHFSLS